MRDAHDVILAPVVTEKTAGQVEAGNVYTFLVAKNANKIEIGKAVEMMFEAKVEAVQVAVAKGKAKRFGATLGRRSDWKVSKTVRLSSAGSASTWPKSGLRVALREVPWLRP